MDPKVKKENLERMFKEGVEKAMALLKYIQSISNDESFKSITSSKKMNYVRKENPDLENFIQIHPIVAQYIITENIFNKECFRKYIHAVFGYEKTKEDMEFLAKDPKNIYFYKNKQYALYVKYLMREYNKHIDQSVINNAYNKMVDELNKETKAQFEFYEKKKEEMNILDNELNDEKRKEFIEFLQKNYA